MLRQRRIPDSILDEIEQDDTIHPDAQIFHNRMLERNEAVQNPRRFAEYVTAELKKQKESKEESPESDCADGSEKQTSNRTSSRIKKLTKKNDAQASPSTGVSEVKPPSPELVLSKRTQNRLNKMYKQHDEQRRMMELSLPSDEPLDEYDVILCEDDPFDQINVKIRCRGKIILQKMKMADNFSEVFHHIAKEHTVALSQIMIFNDDVPVLIDDTPKKLGLNAAHLLNCCIFASSEECPKNNNCIEIKIQSKDSKEKKKIMVHKLDPFSILMEKYSQEKGLSLHKLVFEFDGDKILPNQTAVDIEIEDGNVIDCRVL